VPAGPARAACGLRTCSIRMEWPRRTAIGRREIVRLYVLTDSGSWTDLYYVDHSKMFWLIDWLLSGGRGNYRMLFRVGATSEKQFSLNSMGPTPTATPTRTSSPTCPPTRPTRALFLARILARLSVRDARVHTCKRVLYTISYRVHVYKITR